MVDPALAACVAALPDLLDPDMRRSRFHIGSDPDAEQPTEGCGE